MKISAKQRERNRAFRSQLRAAIRDLRAMTEKDAAATKYREVVSLLDQAAGVNLIHRRNADRNKSRLAQFVARLS